ncbi:MAG: DUF342 domain-containing protein [Halanaerobiales bacterium]|nr:DUF342 domain-containing protein [Halanaerobiales bacterium]
MAKEIKVVAKDTKTAITQAIQDFSSELKRKVVREEIKLVKKNQKSGFMGFGKKTEYTFKLVEKGSIAEDALMKKLLKQTPDLNGYFRFKFAPEGIFLKIVPPKGNGKPASMHTIKQMVAEKQLIDVDLSEVENALKEGNGDYIKIAERKPELDRNAELEIKISSDGLTAYASYVPSLGGKNLTLGEALKIIKDKGVCFGIDESKIAEMLNENIKQEIVIAVGQPPQEGNPAELRYNFDLAEDKKMVKELEDGNVDYLNLDLIVNVKNGDLLVTKIPATLGGPGQNVFGKEIKPIPNKDVKLPKGKNVKIGADEMSLFAEIDGQIVFEQDKISVLPVFVVNENVDLETGNIDFIGNVVIKGNVHEGFSIKAEGDIEVFGNVGAATLESGGKVHIHKGFQGKQKGIVTAEGDVQIGFIENGQVITRGSLLVNGEIMHSKITAKMDVIVDGRGLIVGGLVQAGKDISAKILGSTLATPTEVVAGIDPELREEFDQIFQEIESAEENLDKVTKGVSLLRKVKKQLGQLPPDKKSMLAQFESTRSHLIEQKEQLQTQRNFLSKQLKGQKTGKITASDRVFPGVKIGIGQTGYRVKDTIARVLFVYSEGEVKLRSL